MGVVPLIYREASSCSEIWRVLLIYFEVILLFFHKLYYIHPMVHLLHQSALFLHVWVIELVWLFHLLLEIYLSPYKRCFCLLSKVRIDVFIYFAVLRFISHDSFQQAQWIYEQKKGEHKIKEIDRNLSLGFYLFCIVRSSKFDCQAFTCRFVIFWLELLFRFIITSNQWALLY